MKSLKLVAACLALALAGPAVAADMATKAAPSVGYPYSQSGAYFGVGASSSAGSDTVASTGVFAAGAGVDIVGGYQWRGGLDFIALELDATYTNLGSSAITPVGNASASTQWEFEPLVKFGFPITTVTAALPNLSAIFPALPQLPSNLTALNVHPYIYAGIPIRNEQVSLLGAGSTEWVAQGEIGLGMLNQLSGGLVFDTRAGCSFGGGGVALVANGVHSAEFNTTCTARGDFLY